MIVPPHGARATRSVFDAIAQQPCSSPALLPFTPSNAPSTEHALLVLLGKFAQHLGLIDLLQAVPLPQKTRTHRPQSKLIQFLVAILAGLDYLQDFNTGPHPLSQDQAVIASWGQVAFAHYSGLSRTLAAADATTLHAVHNALAQVSRPFLEREVLAIVRSAMPLLIDIDLTGRAVSPSSHDYPDAAFGWMDDAVCKGYQVAISSLSAGPTGRILLDVQRYSGRATSAECLQAAVQAVEAAVGVRPRRRTCLLQERLSTLHSRLTELEQQRTDLLEQIGELQWQQEIARLGTARLSARQQRRCARLEVQLGRAAQHQASLSERLEQLQSEQSELLARLAQLEADNRELNGQSTMVIRRDADLSADANLAWLIEMGYNVLSKVHSGQTSKRLGRTISAEAQWERVGANAEAVALGPQKIGEGRYALEALQVRYQLPEGLRQTTLLYYGEEPAPAAQVWFKKYNGRQVVEAGIKENKGVFTMRRPMVRSGIGMQLQEQFALFGANFVRWAAEWVQEQFREVPAALTVVLKQVKTMVRVLAHSRATLIETDLGSGLVFDKHSRFAGAVLIMSGQVAYQQVLPLFSFAQTRPSMVT